MLQLKPRCENCAVELPAESMDARICSYECTFCESCVDGLLQNVCPNCGGGFVPRPIRPARAWSGGNSLGRHPMSSDAPHRPVDPVVHAQFAAPIVEIPPEQR